MMMLLFEEPMAQFTIGRHASGPTGPEIWFFILALLTVGGAVATVTRRNNIAAVMSLVATFFGLAAMYALLSAHFLAALQVLVYAGAIMTLFVFVIMVLNRDESEPWSWSGSFSKGVGVLALAYLIVKIGTYLVGVEAAKAGAPPPEFGTVAQIGEVLFTDYLFLFEGVSVLLLIAVTAAVVVARSRSHEVATVTGPHEPVHSHTEDHA